ATRRPATGSPKPTCTSSRNSPPPTTSPTATPRCTTSSTTRKRRRRTRNRPLEAPDPTSFVPTRRLPHVLAAFLAPPPARLRPGRGRRLAAVARTRPRHLLPREGRPVEGEAPGPVAAAGRRGPQLPRRGGRPRLRPLQGEGQKRGGGRHLRRQ